MVAQTGKSDVLLKALRDMGGLMKEGLQDINGKLGDTKSSFSLYLSPWSPDQGTEVDVMKELGVDVRLPLNTYEADLNGWNQNEVHTGLNDALSAHAKTTTPFGAMGVVVHVNLVKDELSMSVQVIGHLGNTEKAMSVKNDQVNINELVVPDHQNILDQPVAILNLSQSLTDELPKLDFSFGSFGGIESEDQSKVGKFKINKGDGAKARAYSVPSLRGTAASVGLIDVWMDIFSVGFDLKTLSVNNIDVRISSGIAGVKTALVKDVESDPKVNAQFVDAVNAQIKEKVGASPGLALFENLLSNNAEGVIAGFESKVRSKVEKSLSVKSCNSLL